MHQKVRGDVEMTETGTKQVRRYRDVSDLRTQFQCEYRLFLNQKRGMQFSSAAQQGAHLHERVKLHAEGKSQSNLGFRIVVIAVTILAAFLWIFG
ncbi:MAG: hypothetical protein EAX95_15220 [Candidatus Thorarchaeota archaeon]|nr:hypothetical protein [Candidatus Thorarchaeota archaeon]